MKSDLISSFPLEMNVELRRFPTLRRKMKEKSWVSTFITQIFLCTTVYIALNIGQPRKHTYGNSSSQGRLIDLYFISVAGGSRPLKEQVLLLEQMAKVAKTYNVRFVVNISELGESDPLLHNATRYYPELRKIPWYTTKASKGQGKTYFLKRIEIPYGQTLDIIALDTKLFQNLSSVPGNDQLQWLMRTLQKSDTDWRIVVGFHHLVTCDYNIQKVEKETPIEPLHSILLQYGVDAYLSRQICSDRVQGEAMQLANTGPMDKVPQITSMNQHSVFENEEIVNVFLLHSITSLEMVTFYVRLNGEVEHKIAFQQRGRAVM